MDTRRLAIGWLAASTTAVAIACSSFGDAQPEQSVADSGADAPSSDDAASTSSDDGDVDAGLDPGCSRLVDEKFETDLASWEPETSPDASVSIVAEIGRNATNALSARVVPTHGGGFAQIEKHFDAPIPKSVALSFAMRVTSHNTEYFEIGCTLRVDALEAATYWMINAELTNGQLALDDNARSNGSGFATDASASLGVLDTTRWYVIRVDLADLTPGGARVRASVDDFVRFDGPAVFPAPANSLQIKCGIDHTKEGGAATVLIDDVTFDVCR